jgi:protein-disulfide isomerase
MVRLKKDLADGPITQIIQENLKIGDALKITGTPSYVIGEDVVIGAVGLETLQRKAVDYRKACASDKTKCI